LKAQILRFEQIPPTATPYNSYAEKPSKFPRTPRGPNSTAALRGNEVEKCLLLREGLLMAGSARWDPAPTTILPLNWLWKKAICLILHLASGTSRQPPSFSQLQKLRERIAAGLVAQDRGGIVGGPAMGNSKFRTAMGNPGAAF